jgi:glycosyltransferase involved in cell wall biosynthesis
MRIVHLSTYDRYGGAAQAGWRLHRALRETGEDSRMLVRRRSAGSDAEQPGGVWLRGWLRSQRRFDRLPLRNVGPKAAGFSIGWVPGPTLRAVRRLNPDVVHAQWLADGFVRIEALSKIRTPLVWTLHDMWAFTGGCHYAGACEGFLARCGCCPLLSSRNEHDFSRKGWRRRRGVVEKSKLVFVAPSRWMAGRASASSLLRDADVRVIPNGTDCRIFAPRDRSVARASLGLPQRKFLVLAGAVQLRDERKGFAHLLAALEHLRRTLRGDAIEVVLFGAGQIGVQELGGFRVHHLGVLVGDEALNQAYSAAEVFVLPSLEDNLPNTAVEAMASGTPVIGYSTGGVPEIVDDGENGLLATVGRPELLAKALLQIVNAQEFRQRCSLAAREKAVRCFDLTTSAAVHRALYTELTSSR